MKIFQTIHKYVPHIPQFEVKHGITDNTSITFDELRRLIVDDGYASSYILQPALEHKVDQVFYTIWDYERLQLLWAKEHGLETKDLAEIKLAQLEWFKPDVFYNMSAFFDQDFIELVKLRGLKCKAICWNGIIQPRPMTFPLYNVHLTLHRPYINYWRGLGLAAFELQPGIPDNWNYDNANRPVDILFYGQYSEGMFTNRNKLINQLMDFKLQSEFNILIHLQYKERKRVLLSLSKVKIAVTRYPPKKIRHHAASPIYGSELYQKINISKIVINAYTDDNKDFKSNMRVFEAIGHGAFLISERGNYPEGLIPDVDFYTYEDFDELQEKIEFVLNNWKEHEIMAQVAAEKMHLNFSKERQWEGFKSIASSV